MEDIIPDITSMPQAIVVQRGQTAKFHCEATVSNSKSIYIIYIPKKGIAITDKKQDL